ncbi:MAG: RagB/SusD family nutrient uptake outer membrane protein [Flavobacteriales bacterium TMED96]|nr:MAG: RagB/SusD family nutrient uptake outer membrane protein [Flavobacteriales bacterium TMED96]|tara:strand:- start:1710 stop:3356 length:1647 start_codon:yes stop_codon:yes gene_type:complete
MEIINNLKMIKMNKFITTILSLSIITFVISCTDLDEDLRGVITSDISVEGIATDDGGSGGGDALGGAFAGLRSTGTGGHTNWYSAQELTSDEMVVTTKGGDWYDGGWLIDFHQHNYKNTNPSVNNNWNSHYGAVATTNELLAAGTLDANGTAQIKALRAYYFWRLMDMYGNIKLPTSPGVDVKQSTRLEAFTFIESELLSALGVSAVSASMDLSGSALGTDKNPYRLNRYGVLGILAKLYLNAEVYTGTPRYQEAHDAADYIINNGGYTLCGVGCKVKNLGKRPAVATDPDELEGFAAVFAPNNAGNQEHIWTVNYEAGVNNGFNLAMMALHYSSQITWNFDSQPWNGYSTLEAFYNSFDENDARKKASFIAGPQLDYFGNTLLDYATDDGDPELDYTPAINEIFPDGIREAGARPGKFSYKQFGRSDMDNDFTLLRLGQIYLIRAESAARVGGGWDGAAALTDTNIIRARANATAYTAAQLTETEFLAERGREMFSEAVRRTDLIRFGAYGNAWWEKSASTANKTIFPIPFDAIQAANGTLTQNPGY